jgi:hypothetical protein
MRIVLAHFHVKRRNLARGDIGRVRHHQIERRHKGLNKARAEIRAQELRALRKAERPRIRSRGRERALVVGEARTRQRLRSLKAVPRPELAEALEIPALGEPAQVPDQLNHAPDWTAKCAAAQSL